MNTLVERLLKIQEKQLNFENRLSRLLKERKQIENSLNNIMLAVEMLAIEKGIMNNTTNNRMKELETKQEEIDKQILLEKSKTILKVSKNDMLNYYKQASELMPDILVNYLIKEIIVYDDKLEIKYNTPFKINPDNQGFLFAKITRTFRNRDIQIECYI